MTEPGPDQATRPEGQRPPVPRFAVPNAERYVLEADALRRRQLRSALLHGSRRTWREHRRIWPAVVVGVLVVALIALAMSMTNAFREDQQDAEDEQSGRLVHLQVDLQVNLRVNPVAGHSSPVA